MTQFSDLLRQGKVPPFGPIATFSGNPRAAALSPGVEVPAEAFYTCVPQTSVLNSLALFQTLSNAAFALQAGTGITTTSINGVSYFAMDVPRCLIVTGGSSGVLPVTLNAVGLDQFQQPMTQSFSGPSGSGNSVTKKAFMYLASLTALNNTVSGLEVGQADTLGFPAFSRSFEEVGVLFNGAPITVSTGYTQGDTATASAITGDVRGTYALQSASNGFKRFAITINIADPDTLLGVYGQTQA